MNAMVHAAGDELSNKFADFSAGWLKDGADDGLTFKTNKTNGRKRLTPVKRDAPIANRNISSIVSRIRDEGAAFSGSNATNMDKQTRQDVSSKSVKEARSETNMEFADTCDDDIVSLSSNVSKAACPPSTEQGKGFRKRSQPPFSAVCDQPVDIGVDKDISETAESAQKKPRKKPIFLIAIISFMMIAVFGYMSYQLKLQSDEMKQTLLMYKQAMDEENMNYDKSLSVATVAIENKVSSVLKAVAPAIISENKNGVSTNINVIKLVNEEPSIVKEKKSAVKIKLTTKLTASVEGKKIEPTTKPLPIKKSAVKTYVAADKPIMFSVNLASFSDRAKAYSQLGVYESFGVSPIVEQALVGNKTIYRLCVEGFSSREEADGFISGLNKKHAINAWVRQS